MNTRSKLSALAAAAAFAVAVPRALEAWETGDALPAFELQDIAGNRVETEGKVVLVDFWASWCAPCKESLPELDALYLKYKDKGFTVVAFSQDETAKAMQRFLARAAPSFPVVSDAEHRFASAAKVAAMPSSYLVDRQGLVRYAHRGWRGDETKTELERQIAALLEEN